MDITKDPAPVLKRELKPVKEITDEVRAFIEEMRQTMIANKGVGLAAGQVGKDLQIFVIDKKLADEHKVPDAYINPEITEFAKEHDELEEGCLSLPGFWRLIQRSKKIKIKALDEQGNKIKFRARGFLARVLQHECDHLQGTLIKDRK